MALITDPDQLSYEVANTPSGTTEVTYSVDNLTITLNSGVGNLSADGATGRAIYSNAKEDWNTDTTLIRYPFILEAITTESMIYRQGWEPVNDSTRVLHRTVGWTEQDTSGSDKQIWSGVITLGTVGASDQIYFDQGAGSTLNATYTGALNEPVKVFGDATHGNFDRRSQLDVFVREENKTFDSSDLSAIGVTSMTFQVYRFPLSNGTDIKYVESDANISSTSPYTEIGIKYFDGAYQRDVDTTGSPRSFGIVFDVGTHSGIDGSFSASGTVLTTADGGIDTTPGRYDGGTIRIHEGTDANTTFNVASVTATTVTITGGTFTDTESGISFTLQRATPVVASLQEIYERRGYLLRQSSDIDDTSGSVIGNTADDLMRFVGDAAEFGGDGSGLPAPTNPNGGGSGVIVEGFDSNDTNLISAFDNSGTSRSFPFTAAGSVGFNSFLQSDVAAVYRMYFSYTHTLEGTDLAITSASGITATLTSTTTDLSEISNNEQFLVEGFSNADNNGLYRATGAGTTNSVAVSKVSSSAADFVNESAGASVTIKMNPYGSTSAITVNDFDGNPIAGNISGSSSVAYTFDFDNNVQGGRTAGVNAVVRVVAIGVATAYVGDSGEQTITRATGQSISVVAPQERVYTT